MTLEGITIAFVVAVFVLAEARRVLKGDRGIITGCCDTDIPMAASCSCTVTVRMSDGREVAAKLDGCTACMGRLSVGDEVRVSTTSDGHVVTLPWFRSRPLSRKSTGCVPVSYR
jgi:hypothetical protein